MRTGRRPWSRARAFAAPPRRRRRDRGASRDCRRRPSTPGGRCLRAGLAPARLRDASGSWRGFRAGPTREGPSNSRPRQANRGPTNVMSAKAGAPPAAGIEMSTCRSPRAVSSACTHPASWSALRSARAVSANRSVPLNAKRTSEWMRPSGASSCSWSTPGAAWREARAAAAQRQRGAARLPSHDGRGARDQIARQVAGRGAGGQQLHAQTLGVGAKARVAIVVDDRHVVQTQCGKGGQAAWRTSGLATGPRRGNRRPLPLLARKGHGALDERDIEAVKLAAEQAEGKTHGDLLGLHQRRRGAASAEPQALDLSGPRDQVERDVAPREVERLSRLQSRQRRGDQPPLNGRHVQHDDEAEHRRNEPDQGPPQPSSQPTTRRGRRLLRLLVDHVLILVWLQVGSYNHWMIRRWLVCSSLVAALVALPCRATVRHGGVESAVRAVQGRRSDLLRRHQRAGRLPHHDTAGPCPDRWRAPGVGAAHRAFDPAARLQGRRRRDPVDYSGALRSRREPRGAAEGQRREGHGDGGRCGLDRSRRQGRLPLR